MIENRTKDKEMKIHEQLKINKDQYTVSNRPEIGDAERRVKVDKDFQRYSKRKLPELKDTSLQAKTNCPVPRECDMSHQSTLL